MDVISYDGYRKVLGEVMVKGVDKADSG